MLRSLALLTFILLSQLCEAQYSRHVVNLKDKQFNTYSISNPSQFLSQRAIERRARYNIPYDSTDLPVTKRYIDSIRNAGAVIILGTSKWLNTITIKTTDAAALAKINSFPFVVSVQEIAPLLNVPSAGDKFGETENTYFTDPVPSNLTDHYNYGRSNGQVKIHNGHFLHNLGFRGNDMRLAMLDAGYYRYLELQTFDSAKNNGQFLDTWDFVANESSVNEDHNHGMHCLSTIAANMPGQFVGTAPKAGFLLYRTEDVSGEFPVEEYNLAAGFERADSAGADICNISLGYYHFDNPSYNYSYAQMDGNTTTSAKAADLAARKGMLIVTSAGNEGNNFWHYITTPADADSAITVGAVDTLGNIASFSSYGPSADGDVKPDVASVGLRAIVANTSQGVPIYGNGTSFAAPNLAGVITCLWQAFPEVNNMRIIKSMQDNAHRAANPDDRVGYGIPDAKAAFVDILRSLAVTTGQAQFNCTNLLRLKVKADSVMDIRVERKLPGEPAYTLVHTWQGTGSFSEKNFSYTDDITGTGSGTTWYRMTMNISTDTTFFIDSVAINQPDCIITANNIQVNPNPVVNDMNVIISRVSPAKFTINIFNALGQRIYTRSGEQTAGRSHYVFPMAGHSRGVYFVQVYIDGKPAFEKQVLR